MKITWLGQAGLLFDNGKTKIMVDPYLSDSVVKVNPLNYRRVPIDDRFFGVLPDVMIFTHDHLDHYDPETAPRFLEHSEKGMTVLCPTSVWQKARQHGGGHNYVEFNRHTEWTEHGFRFSAVKAAHSDPCAIGVLIEDLEEGKVYYVAGDTLYNTEIFEDLPEKIDLVFLPVNGVGNNMNADDALRFAECTGAKRAVPYHIGMFDELTPEIFGAEQRLVLKIYEETEV
ncbi:MAG: MBL fold metallo-hydrolase [Clostridia bacterium]|nr:MBL fold metallo-hydrolase [Clostridia bacterium]